MSGPGPLGLSTVAVGIAVGLLLAAAWHDVRTRLIPDYISVILAILGALYRLHFGLVDFALSVIAALLLFFLLFAAFSRGVVGGGDVKLMVAVALWLSPPDCYLFVVVTAFVGGGLAVLHLALRLLLPKPAAQVDQADVAVQGVLRAELRRIRSGAPLPYAVAISAAGCYVLLGSLGG